MIDRRKFGMGLALSAVAALSIPALGRATELLERVRGINRQKEAPVVELSRLTEHGHLYVHGRLVASTHGTTGDKLWQS